MNLSYLIPIALGLGCIALAAFMWSLRNDQYDDLDGAAHRILLDEDLPAAPKHAQVADVERRR